MITYKVFLDLRRPKSGGKYALMFRVTHDRRNTTYSTGITIEQKHWNADGGVLRSTCPNFKELNKSLTSKYLELQKAILFLEDKELFTFEALKELLHSPTSKQTANQSFQAFAETVIKGMLAVKRTGNAIVYQTAVNKLSEFVDNKPLRFEQVNFALLENFQHHLTLKGKKPNTIGNYLRSIRAIYNKAIKAKIVDAKYYPFADIKIKTEKTAKRATSVIELKVFNNADLNGIRQEEVARLYFQLSFMFRGMSFTDMAYLKRINITGGRLNYRRRKTHKLYNIKMTKKTIALISKLNSTSDYLLPVLRQDANEDTVECKLIIQQWIKTTNKYLTRIGNRCGINNLTTYVARHTWATTAKRLGYSNEMIAEAMGHEYGNRITNIYLDTFEQHLIDDMNEKVIAAVM